MKMKVGRWTDFLIALAGTLFLFTGAVVLVLNLRILYVHEVRTFHLSEEVGLSEEAVIRNYNELIDYNLIWKRKDFLEFSDFPMSEQGRIHFEEVKQIFFGIQYAMIGSFVCFIAGAGWKIRKRQFGFLKLASAASIVIPLGAAGLIAAGWERFFILFHQVMFSNDYWIFDPAADPVILILPDAFFLHCALLIILFILVGSIGYAVLYRLLKKRMKLENENRWRMDK